MKSIFLCLLLLNILYGLWQLQDRSAERALREVADQTLEEGLPVVPADAEVIPLVPPVREAAAPLCINFGTFSREVRAEQLLQRLLALGIQSSVIEREIPGEPDFWVVMDIEGGRREALAQITILQDRDVESYLITEGPLADNVSFGIFESEEEAASRQAELGNEGYPARVQRVNQTNIEYLVQVAQEARRLVDQALLTRLQVDFPELQQQYQVCTENKEAQQDQSSS